MSALEELPQRGSLLEDEEDLRDDKTPHDRFVRLALKRVPLAVKQLELVGNLSGYGYEYSESEKKSDRNA